jgi:preprotein translocase subunit SecD
LNESAAGAEEALQEYKHQKAEEMEQIHDKLQAVLSKKNVTISQLRASLEAAHVRLEAHEKDVRREKRELLEQLGKW